MVLKIISAFDDGLNEIVLPVRGLLRQLTDDDEAVDDFSVETLKRTLVGQKAHIVTLWTDNKKTLVGIGMLTVRQHMLRKVAHIDEVVVDEAYRGRGFGKIIVGALIDLARSASVHHIDLSTRSHRFAAIGLYKSLGFQKSETNCFRLHL